MARPARKGTPPARQRAPRKHDKPTRLKTPAASASPAEPVVAETPEEPSLTAQQTRFIDELLADPEMNGTRAAMKAYPAQSYETAAVTSSENLRKPKIVAEIKRRMAPTLKKARMSRERVLSLIDDAINYDVAEAFNEDGSLKAVRDMPPDVRRQIASIEVEEIRLAKDGPVVGCVKKIKLVDRVRSNDMAARHHKLLTDRVQVDGKVTLEDIVAASRKKTEAP